MLRVIVSQSDSALLVSAKGDDGGPRICFVNQAFTDLLGYELADLEGLSPAVLVGPDPDPAGLEHIESALRRGGPVTSEVVLRDRSGEPTRVEASYRLLQTSGGTGWFVASFRDLADRREAADALRRSEVWAEALVQGSSDLVMVADDEGVVRYASPALREVLGYEADEFVSRPFVELIHPDDAARTPGVFERRPVSRGGRSHEYRIAHRDGSWHVASLRVADRRDDPAVRGYVVNLRDVSARRRAEDLLGEQADLLESIAKGAPLEITLDKIVRMLERQLVDAAAVIGLLDDDGVIRARASRSLAPEILRFIDEQSPDGGPGQALRSGVGELFEYDLVADPRLGPAAELFAEHGYTQSRDATLRAPRSGELVGALTLFHRVPRDLSQPDIDLVQRAMNLAAIAVERHRFEARARVPGALRPAHRPAQPVPALRADPGGARPHGHRRRWRGRPVLRPRSVQGRQRRRGPRGRRPGAAAGGRAPRGPRCCRARRSVGSGATSSWWSRHRSSTMPTRPPWRPGSPRSCASRSCCPTATRCSCRPASASRSAPIRRCRPSR